jgi:hypothetical protein
MRRITAWLVVATGLHAKCPTNFFRVNNKVDVVVLDFPEPTPVDSHCSRVWPNEEPEIALFPAPPGCLFFGIPTVIGKDDQLPMKLPSGEFLHWIPEPELADSLDIDPFDVKPLKCQRVLSKTVAESKMVVVGEGCDVPKSCVAQQLNATATCEIEEEPTSFLESSGWHRNLGAMLHANFKHSALQWLPRQFFGEPDELDRKARRMSVSVSTEINIENPSLLAPPQLIKVSAFPFPAHARVNPPKVGETHFAVHVPKAIWVVNESVTDCSVEKLRLRDFVKLPKLMNLGVWDGLRLVRSRQVTGDSYAITNIPAGNPQDLAEAVAVTAVMATAGAIAIVVSSLKK